ncbi:MAG: PAS domain S-box protein [Anaerolineae bacterium]
MHDTDRSKEQLLDELQVLRRQVKALQDTHAKWGALFSHSRDAMLVIDGIYNIVDANHAALGGGCVAVGHNALEYVVPEDRSLAREVLDRAFSAQRAETGEHRVLDRNGNRLWCSTQIIPLTQATEEGPYALLNSHCLSPRQKVEAVVAREMPLPLGSPFALRIHQDGTILWANDASNGLLAIWGTSQGGKAPEHVQRQVREALSSGRMGALEEKLGESTFSLGVAPVAGECYASVFSAGISAEHLQDALQVAEQQRNILECLAEGICMVDPGAHTTYANARLATMLGYSREEMLSRPVSDFMDGESAERVRQALSHQAEGGAQERLEVTVRRKDGSHLMVDLNASALRDNEGTYLGGIVAIQDITQRRRTEIEREGLLVQVKRQRESLSEFTEALQEERDRLSVLMELTQANLAYLDAAFNLVAVNSAYVAGSGYSREDLLGRNHFELFPDAENEVIFRHVRDTGKPMRFEAKPFVYAHTPERGVTYWDWTLAPVLSPNGRVTGLVLSLLDVTERVRVQEELERRGNRLRGLVDLGRAILAADSVQEVCDAALGHVQSLVPCERAAVLLFDQAGGTMEVVGSNAPKGTQLGLGWEGPLTPSSLLDDLRQGRSRVLSDLQDFHEPLPTLEILRSEGVRAYAFTPLLDCGELIGTLTIARGTPGSLTAEHLSITQDLATSLAVGIRQMRLREELQRHASRLEELVARRTAALRTSEARLHAVFDASALGIAILDQNFRITQANPALAALFGQNPESLEDTSLWALSHAENSGLHRKLARELLAGRRSTYQIEVHTEHGPGRDKWMNLTVSRLGHASNVGEEAVAMFEDITERKQSEAALIQAERLSIIGRLSASLLHEINNPLQAVVGCVGLAREAYEEEGNPAPYLEVAAEELMRTSRILSRLRNLEHIPELADPQPTALGVLLERSLALTVRERAERDIQVVVDIPERLPLVYLAADAMQQVFLNLLLNATDAMPEGGTLRVSAERTNAPSGVRVVVSDTGPGIDQESLQSIFEPFSGTKTRGLGLGLFVSQDIVRRHGGTIVASSSPGQGATFTVWLPA